MSGALKTKFHAEVSITNQGIMIRPSDGTMFGILFPNGNKRKWNQPRPHDPGFRSILNEDQVEEIAREAWAAKESGERMVHWDAKNAPKYGITPGTIRSIRLGKRWRWVVERVFDDLRRGEESPDADPDFSTEEYDINETEDSGVAAEDLI